MWPFKFKRETGEICARSFARRKCAGAVATATATTSLLCNTQRVKTHTTDCVFYPVIMKRKSGTEQWTVKKKQQQQNIAEKMKTHWRNLTNTCVTVKKYGYIYMHKRCDTILKKRKKQANTISYVQCSNPSDPICCLKFLIRTRLLSLFMCIYTHTHSSRAESHLRDFSFQQARTFHWNCEQIDRTPFHALYYSGHSNKASTIYTYTMNQEHWCSNSRNGSNSSGKQQQ